MGRRPSRWFRAGVLAGLFVLAAPCQVYRSDSIVLAGTIRPTLRRVLGTVSEQPGTLVLLADPDAGTLTTARLLTGVELEQSALQPAPAPAALSLIGIFLRAVEQGYSEVYAHSLLLVMEPGETHPQFLGTTGHPETQLMAELNPSAEPAPRPSRVLPMPAGGVWDALRRLEAQGLIEVRFTSPELGVATMVRWGQRSVTIGTLFAEEVSPTETRAKVSAIVLSTPECLPVPHAKAGETTLLDLIAGGGGKEPAVKPAAGSARFCLLLTQPSEFIPLYRIRSSAARKSIAADAESVWSALLLLLRQFAVVTAVDKAKWRIQYQAPCRQNPPPEPREKRFTELILPRPGCTTAAWLEAQQSAADLFAGFAVALPDGRSRLETLLEKVASQVFVEEKLGYLTKGSQE